jgi:hypothetical protein
LIRENQNHGSVTDGVTVVPKEALAAVGPSNPAISVGVPPLRRGRRRRKREEEEKGKGERKGKEEGGREGKREREGKGRERR